MPDGQQSGKSKRSLEGALISSGVDFGCCIWHAVSHDVLGIGNGTDESITDFPRDFMAGLKNIDTSLYEAASIDGATGWQRYRFITIPLLKPTTIYVLTISIYAGLAMFLESFMLWNGNSSPNNVGLTIVGYLYRRGIEKNQLGYASAVGLVLLAIALVINVVQLILNGTFKKEKD